MFDWNRPENYDETLIYNELLHGDSDEYYRIFDTLETDVVVGLLRTLQQEPNEENMLFLVAKLEQMLITYLRENILCKQ